MSLRLLNFPPVFFIYYGGVHSAETWTALDFWGIWIGHFYPPQNRVIHPNFPTKFVLFEVLFSFPITLPQENSVLSRKKRGRRTGRTHLEQRENVFFFLLLSSSFFFFGILFVLIISCSPDLQLRDATCRSPQRLDSSWHSGSAWSSA